MPCMTCKHAEMARDETGKVVIGAPVRVCIRFPPVPILMPTARGGLAMTSAWPQVPCTATCHEYSPREGVEVMDIQQPVNSTDTKQ